MLGTATLTGAALGGVAAVTVAPVLMLGAATALEAGEPCTIAAASAPAVTTTPAAIIVKGVIFVALIFFFPNVSVRLFPLHNRSAATH
jgi:hypothetical protein